MFESPCSGLYFFKEVVLMTSVSTVERAWESRVGGDTYNEP